MYLLFLFRNRRSGQGDRLSGVNVTLQYGSESEDDPVLSGRCFSALGSKDVYFVFVLKSKIAKKSHCKCLQAPCVMTRESQKLRVRVLVWR